MLQALIYTAQRAGGAIMAVHARGIDVRDKADASPVTLADEAAEKIILEDLADIAPGVPVVAKAADTLATVQAPRPSVPATSTSSPAS